jgi:hypothetical protein
MPYGLHQSSEKCGVTCSTLLQSNQCTSVTPIALKNLGLLVWSPAHTAALSNVIVGDVV